MQEQEWIILDTETTGLIQPVYTLEIAAQRMRGLKPVGEIFQIYLNHDIDVPYGAQQVHGYSRQFLAKNGVQPLDAYRAFSHFANNAPICAYNLPYDYDTVLRPEWQRLRLPELAPKGFCLMKLTQQLLDPTVIKRGPGQFKLQSLKDRFKLPDRVAHSASGDVLTIIDLLEQVLSPKFGNLGLTGYTSLKNYLGTAGYPDVLMFGKFKGRAWRDADTDLDLYNWLRWLAKQPQSDGTDMAKWCLKQLRSEEEEDFVKQPTFSTTRADTPSKVVRSCSACGAQVRLPADREGYVLCPKCRTRFFAKT
jgi:DNA polymerase III epsilon subunit-like protein